MRPISESASRLVSVSEEVGGRLSPSFRGLAFDVFGTVVDWRGSIAGEAERILAASGHRADWNAIALSWRRRYQPSMDRVRGGEQPWTLLDDLHAESIGAVLAEQGLRRVSKADRRELVMAWHRLAPWPDSAPGLRRLGTHFRLVTLSNGNQALLTELVRAAELPFDEVLSAEDVRAYKPDPSMYMHAVRTIGGSPEETLMVAAHLDDLQAAAQCGLATAFVVRPREWSEAGEVPDPPKPWLDYYATDLEDLATQLSC